MTPPSSRPRPRDFPRPHIATLTLSDEHATDRLGETLAGLTRPGDTLLLSGSLGAGKSHLARALILHALAAAGRPAEDVPSPTYTLVQSYDLGVGEILHADLYRIAAAEDVIELGLTEAFGRDLCLVEWPDRLGPLAPPDALHIHLAADGAGRRAEISGADPWRTCLAAMLATSTKADRA